MLKFFFFTVLAHRRNTLDTLSGGCEGCVGGGVFVLHTFCPCVFINPLVQSVHINLQKEGEWLSSCVAEFFFHLCKNIISTKFDQFVIIIVNSIKAVYVSCHRSPSSLGKL